MDVNFKLLKGSEKQVAWAEEIRDLKLAEIDALIAKLDAEAAEFGDDYDRRKVRRLRGIRLAYVNTSAASTIIDYRDCPPESLFFETFRESDIEVFAARAEAAAE
jgi:hypothetical protein